MSVRVGVPREADARETRVALVPSVVNRYLALGATILLQRGAGQRSWFADDQYDGVTLVDAAGRVFAADIVLKVKPPTLAEVGLLQPGTVLVGLLQPYTALNAVAALRDRGVTSFALELLPRITRAQSMDALTSQASIAGYKAALLAASLSGRYFPMLTTPAGTLRPARVVVLGAGVAGLQAITTARRLGALVEAYDVRSATRDQVHSLGARFIDVGIDAESSGGYARELAPEEQARAQEVIDRHIVDADIVITTAAVPGHQAPRLVSSAVVERMKPGAVIVDLAAETGGNVALTRPGERYETANGVTIYGPLNVAAMVPTHASEQYAHNVFNFIAPHLQGGELHLNWDDEVLAASVLTRNGEVVNAAIAERLERQEGPVLAEVNAA